jgi:antitoxin (DNA-binding transcriptional repressor) of toxin-antitoxin stability system
MTILDGPNMNEAVLEINVTEFKATCLALFKELEARRYDKVVVTRRGRPIAQLTPAVSEVPDLYGALKGRVMIPPGVDLTEPVLEDIPEAESGGGPFF